MVGTWHPHHQHQGQKGVGHVHLGPLGNHLQGHFGVSMDSLGLPDAEYLTDWDLAPTPPAPGTKEVGNVPPGGLGDHLQGYMGYQQIRWASQMQNILFDRTCHPNLQHQGLKGLYYDPAPSVAHLSATII